MVARGWSFAVTRAVVLSASVIAFVSQSAGARTIEVTDDSGARVQLHQPAARIASLAPHATELLFAAGAGAKVVAVGAYSDYPESAKRLPVVSDAFAINVEALSALKPDLIVVWQSGSSPKQREQLRRLGFPVFVSEPKRLNDIPTAIQTFGQLADTRAAALQESQRLARELASLKATFSKRREVPTLFAMGGRTPMSVSGKHFVSDVIRLCGGRNVFDDLPSLAANVSIEAIVQRAPLAIVRPGRTQDSPVPEPWQSWPLANLAERMIVVDGDHLLRPTARLVIAARQVCDGIDRVRSRAQ
jgi:iron complex transport system substrate-binding protein